MAPPNRQPPRPPAKAPDKYIRSSSFTRNFLYDSENGGPQEKVPAPLEPVGTEEVGFTLTAGKVEELLQKIHEAQNDPACDGGIRVTMYMSHKTNKESGEEFDSLSFMVTGKFPAKNFDKKGSFGGAGGNRGGGQGRRDYPSQQGNGSRQPQGQQASANNPPAGPNKPPANSAPTRDAFEDKHMGKSQDSPQTTSPSSGKFNQEPRW